MPLARSVDSALRVDIEMFSRGGLAVLDAIEVDRIQHARASALDPEIEAISIAGARARPCACFHARPHVPCLPLQPSPGGWQLLKVAVFSRTSRRRRIRTAAGWRASYAECHRIARAARSNFYYAFYLLPKPKRDGLAALYAFMRLVDDVSDVGENVETTQRGLAKWRAAFDEAVTGRSQFFDGTAVTPLARLTLRRGGSPARASGHDAPLQYSPALFA